MSKNRYTFPGGLSPQWNKPSVEEFSDPPVSDTTEGTDRDNATIEVEKDEVILTPDLKLFKVKGETHANGGVPYFAEGGEFIYSDKLKMKGKHFKSLMTQSKLSAMSPEVVNKLRANIKPDDELDVSGLSLKDDKDYSFADIASKFKTNQDLANLGEDNEQSTLYTKTSAQLNLQGKLKNLSLLSTLQESLKQAQSQRSYELGGSYDVTPEEADELRRQGYDFETH